MTKVSYHVFSRHCQDTAPLKLKGRSVAVVLLATPLAEWLTQLSLLMHYRDKMAVYQVMEKCISNVQPQLPLESTVACPARQN